MKVKLTLLIFFCLLSFMIQSQSLHNSEWVQIKSERKDGSRIVKKNLISPEAMKYYFIDTSVYISMNDQYSESRNYVLQDNILSIGENVHYNIETLDNIVMILTEIPSAELPDDKINRYVFIKSKYLFDYLNQAKALNITGDSMITTDKVFSPVYRGDLNGEIKQEFESRFTNAEISGSIILSADGYIKDIIISPGCAASKRDIKRFTEVLKTSKNQWSIPSTPKPFQFLITFSSTLFFKPNSSTFSFSMHPGEKSSSYIPSLKEQWTADGYFSKGVEFCKKENWDKALTAFSKCIKIDSFNVDAYYNEALCYQKLGQNEAACNVWRMLKDMGQKNGEILYSENCEAINRDK